MNLIEILENECECVETVYLQYIQNRSKNEIFLFFEGKDDYKYYRVRIEPFFLSKKYKHYVCESKSNVIDLHRIMKNQTKEDKGEKLLFFVDKDFDDNTGISNDIYITPVYSIENLYVSNRALENMIIGEMGFSGEIEGDEEADYEFALDYLIKSRSEIIESVIFVNAWYYLQKNKYNCTGESPKLYDIKEYKKIKGIKCCEELKKLVPNAIEVSTSELDEVLAYLKSDPVKYIRGKYFEQAMPYYFNQIFQDSCKTKERKFFRKKRKVSINIGAENMISVLSQYAEFPECLIEYIKRRLL